MVTREVLKTHLKTNFTWFSYIDLLLDYEKWLKVNNKDRVKFNYIPDKPNEIFILSFRFNKEEAFNDVNRNNDLQVIVQRIKDSDGDLACMDYMYDVTIDPKTNKYGIAHFANQIYTGNVGYHQWGIYGTSRICVRSDAGCWYFRTGENEYKFGCIGLNKHNSNNFFNSSLGCEIYANESDYQYTVKPLLKTVVNKNKIPCAIIDIAYINQKWKL